MRPAHHWPSVIGIVLALCMPWSASAAVSPSCYAWDFLNNSGQDADGLVVHLKGISAITDVYTGALNPFGAPDPSSGYNAGTDVYTLIFGGGTVSDSGTAQIGFCAAQPTLRLDSAQPSFYWTVAGTPATPDPLFAGLDFNWIDANHLQVHLYNDGGTALTAYSFSALTPVGALALDDLTDGIASKLPLAGDPIQDPLALGSGASATFDVYFDQGTMQLGFGAPVVLEAVLSTQDDSTNAIHLMVQTSQPFPATLDVDASGTPTTYDALTDGLLVLRYLFGLSGSSLTTGATGGTATRADPAIVKLFLDANRTAFDIDGDGNVDALTDGLLIIRYLFGLRGDPLIHGAIAPGALRNTAPLIENYLGTLTP